MYNYPHFGDEEMRVRRVNFAQYPFQTVSSSCAGTVLRILST